MKDLTDPDYLLQRQYRDASNLQARVALHQHFSTNPQGLLRWFMEQLEIPEDADILEVGCGPGALIQALAARATEGLIVGVDPSPTMLRQAARRNAQAIQKGLVQVQAASAAALPFGDAAFDKALTANSLPFWPDQEAGVREMWRVLTPGGVIAIILQPRWARTDSEVKQIGEGLVSLLSSVGFQQARMEFKPMKPIASVCALGIK